MYTFLRKIISFLKRCCLLKLSGGFKPPCLRQHHAWVHWATSWEELGEPPSQRRTLQAVRAWRWSPTGGFHVLIRRPRAVQFNPDCLADRAGRQRVCIFVWKYLLLLIRTYATMWPSPPISWLKWDSKMRISKESKNKGLWEFKWNFNYHFIVASSSTLLLIMN